MTDNDRTVHARYPARRQVVLRASRFFIASAESLCPRGCRYCRVGAHIFLSKHGGTTFDRLMRAEQ